MSQVGATERKSELEGGGEITLSGERGIAARAVQLEAEVKARYALANRFPRDIARVWERIRKDCQRPGFAKIAMYKLPKGRKPDGSPNFIVGPTIRFAESLARSLGNLDVKARIVYEDERSQVIEVTVTDLETLYLSNTEVSVDRTVERKADRNGKKPDRQILGERVNSYGEVVYICTATEDELLAKRNSAISKARRNLIVQMTPRDILDDAIAEVNKTLVTDHKNQGPDRIKRVVETFAEMGIKVAELQEYLGKNVDRATDEDLADLTGVRNAIKEGSKWSDILAEARATRTSTAPEAPKSAPPPAKPADTITDAEVVEEPPGEDPIAAEVTVLMAGIVRAEGAKDLAALQALAERVKALPSPDKEKVMSRYALALKVVKS